MLCLWTIWGCDAAILTSYKEISIIHFRGSDLQSECMFAFCMVFGYLMITTIVWIDVYIYLWHLVHIILRVFNAKWMKIGHHNVNTNQNIFSNIKHGNGICWTVNAFWISNDKRQNRPHEYNTINNEEQSKSKTIFCGFPKRTNTGDKINVFFSLLAMCYAYHLKSNLVLFVQMFRTHYLPFNSVSSWQSHIYVLCPVKERDFFNVIHRLNNMTQHKNVPTNFHSNRSNLNFMTEPFHRVGTYLPFVVFLVFVSLTFVTFQQFSHLFIIFIGPIAMLTSQILKKEQKNPFLYTGHTLTLIWNQKLSCHENISWLRWIWIELVQWICVEKKIINKPLQEM